MDNLVRTVGLAPSEMPLEKMIEKLGEERKRITAAILQWREENLPKKKKKKKVSRKKRAKQVDNVAKALADIGTDRDKMFELLMKREEEKGKK